MGKQWKQWQTLFFWRREAPRGMDDERRFSFRCEQGEKSELKRNERATAQGLVPLRWGCARETARSHCSREAGRKPTRVLQEPGTLEVRPSSVAPDPAESRGAPPPPPPQRPRLTPTGPAFAKELTNPRVWKGLYQVPNSTQLEA